MNRNIKITTVHSHKGHFRGVERGFRSLVRDIQTSWNGDFVEPDLAIIEIKQIFTDLKPEEADFISYVPSHDGHLGPSEMFARLLSELWSIPSIKIFKRKRNIGSAYYSKERPNYKKQYESIEIIRNNDLTNKKIILVDNVITTGASLAASLMRAFESNYLVQNVFSLTIVKEKFCTANFKSHLLLDTLEVKCYKS